MVLQVVREIICGRHEGGCCDGMGNPVLVGIEINKHESQQCASDTQKMGLLRTDMAAALPRSEVI